MPEWSKGVVSSTTIFGFAGSNPAPCNYVYVCVAKWIRHVTSNHEIAGSSPVVDFFALLAQLVRACDC